MPQQPNNDPLARDRMIEALTDLLSHDDNKPFGFDQEHELPGARGAHGELIQWTCDDGRLLTATSEAASAGSDDVAGVARIGQPLRCVFAVLDEHNNVICLVEFADGKRLYAYATDCRFD